MPIDPSRLRIGDAERTETGRMLDDAYAAGQLTHAEHSERIDRALVAVHASELAALVNDLSVTQVDPLAAGVPIKDHSLRPTSSSASGSPVSMAFLAAAVRAGDWTVAPHHLSVAFWGAIDVDLREARFASSEVSITAVAIMGGIRVIVPPDVRVRVQGVPILGAVTGPGDAADPDGLAPDAPVVTVHGLALMGSVEVVRRDYKDDED